MRCTTKPYVNGDPRLESWGPDVFCWGAFWIGVFAGFVFGAVVTIIVRMLIS